MILDTNLENYPVTVVNNSSVNPVPADGYMGLLQADGLHTYLVASKPNGGALWKIVRSTLPNTGTLGLQFGWTLSPEALLYGRCFEFDTRVTDASGWTYPCDFQFVLQTSGLHLNVATGVAAGKIEWKDSGLFFPTPGQGQLMQMGWEYALDTVNHVCSILTVSNGSQTLAIPGTLQKQPAAQLGWQASQVVFQKQIEVGPAGAVSDVMGNIQYAWS